MGMTMTGTKAGWSGAGPGRLMKAGRLLLLAALTLPVCAFHGFVGWHKAFAPREELVRHSAWTVHLPDWLGRTVGWVELGLCVVLLAALLRPSLARAGVQACLAFVLLELIAALVHFTSQDGGSLTQNAVSVAVTLLLAGLYAWRARP